MRHSMP